MAEFHDEFKDILTQYIYGLRPTPSGWLKTNCQLCHLRGHNADQKQRFGILFSPGGAVGANCFNCGFSASWQPGQELSRGMVFLLNGIGVPKSDVDKLRFNAFVNKSNVHSFGGGILKGSITEKWRPVEEPMPDCHTIRFWLQNNCDDENFIKVVEYAISRNILDIDKMAWTPHKDFMFNKRLTIPYYYRGELVGWTGRLAFGGGSAPKYHNNMPVNFIYGLDDQDDYDKKYVIINEGVIDAIVTDGIGVLHNNINDEQAAVINKVPAQKILCPDRDASGDGLIEIAIENKWAVAFPNWRRDDKGRIIKDASQAAERYGHILTIKSIIDTAETDSFAIRMKRKLDRNAYGY
jgi:hypothetical protein